MAQSFSSGAIHIFLRSRRGGSAAINPIQYFGTCESMPNDSRLPEYEPVMTDISGTKVPFDVAWQGQSATISLVMTRVEQDVVENLLALPSPVDNTPGVWGFNEVGTLMGLENMAWECWLAYSFGAALGDKSAYVGPGFPTRLRKGRHYVQCVLWAPQLEEAGTKPMKQHFMLYAWPKADKVRRIFTLYDYDFTGINENDIQ